MIRKFRIGDLFKNPSSGAYKTDKNIWQSNDEKDITGLSRYDYANEMDFNRTFRELVNNDASIEKVVKVLASRALGQGIESGCTITEDSYDWLAGPGTNSYLSSTIMNTRLYSGLSVPCIPPQSMTDNGTVTTITLTDAFLTPGSASIVSESGAYSISFAVVPTIGTDVTITYSNSFETYTDEILDTYVGAPVPWVISGYLNNTNVISYNGSVTLKFWSGGVQYSVSGVASGYNTFASDWCNTSLSGDIVSTHFYRLSDGVIIGNSGDFYTVEPDYLTYYSILSKVLRLETWEGDTISIDDGNSDLYRTSIDRKENGASTDTTERYTYNFEFDYVDYKTAGLYKELVAEGFNNGTTDLTDILYQKFDNKMLFSRPLADYRWNFVIFNETDRKLEVWFDDATNAVNPTSYLRYQYIDNLDTVFTTLGKSYTLFYSALIDSTGEKENIFLSGYQGCGQINLTSATTILGAAGNYGFTINIDGAGAAEYLFTTLAPNINFTTLIPLLNGALKNPGGTTLSNDGAEFRLVNGDLICFSLATGAPSTIDLDKTTAATEFFNSTNFLGSFTTFATPVAGSLSTWYIDESVPPASSGTFTVTWGTHATRISPAGVGVNMGDEWFETNTGKWYKWDAINTCWVRMI